MAEKIEQIKARIAELEQRLARLKEKQDQAELALPTRLAAVQQAFASCQAAARAAAPLGNQARYHEEIELVAPTELLHVPDGSEKAQWEKDAARLAGCYEDARRSLRDAFQQLPERALLLKDPDWQSAPDGFPDLGRVLLHGWFGHLVEIPGDLVALRDGPNPFATARAASKDALRQAWKDWARDRGDDLPGLAKKLSAQSSHSEREAALLRQWRVYQWADACADYPDRLWDALHRVFEQLWPRAGLESPLQAYEQAREQLLDGRLELRMLQSGLHSEQEWLAYQQRELQRLEQQDEVLAFLEQQKAELSARCPQTDPWYRSEQQPDFPALREHKDRIFSALRRVAEAILQPDAKHERCAFHSYVSSDVRRRLPYGCGIEQRYRKHGRWDASLPESYQTWLREEQSFQAQKLGAEVAMAAAADMTCSCAAGDAMRGLQRQVAKLAAFLETPACLASIERVEGPASDYLKELIEYVRGFDASYFGQHLYPKLLATRFDRLYLGYLEDLLATLKKSGAELLKWEDGKLKFRSGQVYEVTLLRKPPAPPADGEPWFEPDFLAGLEDPVRRLEAMLMVIEVQQILKKPRPALRSSLDDLKALHKNLMDENVIQRWNKDAHWLDYCAKFLRLANQLQLLAHPGDAQGNARTLVELAVHIGLVSGTDQPQSKIAAPVLAAFDTLKRALQHPDVHKEYAPASSEVSPAMRAFNTLVKAGKLPKRIFNAWKAVADGQPNVSSASEAILGGAVAVGAAVSLVFWWESEQASLRDNVSALSDVLTIVAATEDIVGYYRQIALAKQVMQRLPNVTPEAAKWAAETQLGKRWLLRFGLQALGVVADAFVFWIDVSNFQESFSAGYYTKALGQGVSMVGSGTVLLGTSIGTFALMAGAKGWFAASSLLTTLGMASAWCLGLGVGLIVAGLLIAWWQAEDSAEEQYLKNWLRGMGNLLVLDPQYVVINFHEGLRSPRFDQTARTEGSVRLLLQWPAKNKTLHARFMDSDSDGDDDAVPYDGQDSFVVTTDDWGHVYFEADKLQAGLYAQSEGVFGSYSDLYLELSEDGAFTPGTTWYSKYWSCELDINGRRATIRKAREQDFAGIDVR